MYKDLRFCLIGRGSIGTRHLRNLKFFGYNNIVAFSEMKRPIKDKEYFEQYQIKTVHTVQELKEYKPDACIIANPTSKHLASVNLALNINAHIFLEKPFSYNLNGVAKFRKKLIQKGKVFFQANCLRFHPAILKIKEMINNGDFGKIYFARIQVGQFLPDWHFQENYRISYASKKSLGGGVVLTLQHEIDYVYWFFGKFDKINSLVRKISDLKIDVEDVASIIAEMKNEQLVEIHMDYLQRPSQRTIQIQGSRGSIDYKFTDRTMKFFDFRKREMKQILKLNYNYNQMYLDELKHFIDCILNNTKPLISIEDAIYTLKVCLKIKQKSI